jgi:hypothetical protein
MKLYRHTSVLMKQTFLIRLQTQKFANKVMDPDKFMYLPF